ncbi:MAG: hypothetical protein LBM93_07890 [Oscillospiraceae bacterium]|jgi:hypothetical protein|nr:hypothetical protein [Oscillospiraceae bacterium]
MNIYEKLSPIEKIDKEKIKMKAERESTGKRNRQWGYKIVSFATCLAIVCGATFFAAKHLINKDDKNDKLSTSLNSDGTLTLNDTSSDSVVLTETNEDLGYRTFIENMATGYTAYMDFETATLSVPDDGKFYDFNYFSAKSKEEIDGFLVENFGEGGKELDFSEEFFEVNTLFVFAAFANKETVWDLESLVLGDGKWHFFLKQQMSEVSRPEAQTDLIFVSIPRKFVTEKYDSQTGSLGNGSENIKTHFISAYQTYNAIDIGTYADNVYSILGEPDSKSTDVFKNGYWWSYVLENGGTRTYYFDKDNVIDGVSFNNGEEQRDTTNPESWENSFVANSVKVGDSRDDVIELMGDGYIYNNLLDKYTWNVTLYDENSVPTTHVCEIVFDENGLRGVYWNGELSMGQEPEQHFVSIVNAVYDEYTVVPPLNQEAGVSPFKIDYLSRSDDGSNPYLIFHHNDLGILFVYEFNDVTNIEAGGKIIVAIDLRATIGEFRKIIDDYGCYYVNVDSEGKKLTISTSQHGEYKYCLNLENIGEKESLSFLYYRALDYLPTVWTDGNLSTVDYGDYVSDYYETLQDESQNNPLFWATSTEVVTPDVPDTISLLMLKALVGEEVTLADLSYNEITVNPDDTTSVSICNLFPGNGGVTAVNIEETQE